MHGLLREEEKAGGTQAQRGGELTTTQQQATLGERTRRTFPVGHNATNEFNQSLLCLLLLLADTKQWVQEHGQMALGTVSQQTLYIGGECRINNIA